MVRLLTSYDDAHYKAVFGGPCIANLNLVHALMGEDWVDIKDASFNGTWKDGLIPWSKNVRPDLDGYRDIPAIFGPDFLFYCSFDAEYSAKRFFEDPYMMHLFLLNGYDTDTADMIIKDSKKFRGAVSRCIHALRPDLYDLPFYEGKKEYDVLFLIKSANVLESVRGIFKNPAYITYAKYDYDELIYKAQRSEFCIYASGWESYGLAFHEIASVGCPLITTRFGMQEGNMAKGTGYRLMEQSVGMEDGSRVLQSLLSRNSFPIGQRHRLSNVMVGSDMVEIEKAIDYVRSLDSKSVRDAELEFSSYVNIRNIYRTAIENAVDNFKKMGVI